MSILLYASETWTLLAADIIRLEAFHMRCPWQLLAGPHHQWGNPDDNKIDTIARYPVQVEDITVRSCRLTQPNQALWIQTDHSTGWKPDVRWWQTPDQPRKSWCWQIWTNVGMSPRNYWDVCIYCGHSAVRRNDDDDEYEWTLSPTVEASELSLNALLGYVLVC